MYGVMVYFIIIQILEEVEQRLILALVHHLPNRGAKG